MRTPVRKKLFLVIFAIILVCTFIIGSVYYYNSTRKTQSAQASDATEQLSDSQQAQVAPANVSDLPNPRFEASVLSEDITVSIWEYMKDPVHSETTSQEVFYTEDVQVIVPIDDTTSVSYSGLIINKSLPREDDPVKNYELYYLNQNNNTISLAIDTSWATGPNQNVHCTDGTQERAGFGYIKDEIIGGPLFPNEVPLTVENNQYTFSTSFDIFGFIRRTAPIDNLQSITSCNVPYTGSAGRTVRISHGSLYIGEEERYSDVVSIRTLEGVGREEHIYAKGHGFVAFIRYDENNEVYDFAYVTEDVQVSPASSGDSAVSEVFLPTNINSDTVQSREESQEDLNGSQFGRSVSCFTNEYCRSYGLGSCSNGSCSNARLGQCEMQSDVFVPNELEVINPSFEACTCNRFASSSNQSGLIPPQCGGGTSDPFDGEQDQFNDENSYFRNGNLYCPWGTVYWDNGSCVCTNENDIYEEVGDKAYGNPDSLSVDQCYNVNFDVRRVEETFPDWLRNQ